MTFETAVVDLLERFPEFREVYESERLDAKGTDPETYTVYNLFRVDMVEPALDRGDVGMIARIFDYIERMATCTDRDTVDLVALELIAPLANDDGRLAKARQYMKSATLDISLAFAPPDWPPGRG